MIHFRILIPSRKLRGYTNLFESTRENTFPLAINDWGTWPLASRQLPGRTASRRIAERVPHSRKTNVTIAWQSGGRL